MHDALQVLVVGAGPVGLVSALRLARAGIAVRIVDAAADIDTRMRASTLHPPTLDMLAALGLAEPLIRKGLKVDRWQLRQHDNGEFVNFELAKIADRTRHPFQLQVEQKNLCSLAGDALEELGVGVEFETSVESLEQDESGVAVRVGADGDVIRARWVIGADGADSAVRRSLGIDFPGRSYEFCSVMVATPFPFHRKIDHLEPITYCWSNRGPFSLLRMKKLWRVCLYPDSEEFEAATGEKFIRDWLEYIAPDSAETTLTDITPYRTQERCADRFRVGRVCLAGDAAHLNPSSGGMGMNGGIHDAVNLTEKLIEVLGGGNHELMDRYDRQRRYAATEMVIPRASANKARMTVGDPDAQMRRLTRYRAIADDSDRCREYILASSMITGLEAANAIE